MSDGPAIIVDNVSKMYHKRAGTGTLLSMIPGFRPSGSDEFWALKDVSFEVKPGECLGIIGPNGAGKSTILKILSRVTPPTSGTYRVNGRMSSLIEVGAGFHPELSGRENVYLNAAILGMSKKEVEAKFDEIVEFAELGEFIDVPVKRYSSGMYVRLGFAVAIHTEPDVLLVDEVLAVGDERFRSRCMDRMRELRRRDVAVIFVSHSLVQVRKFCSRVGLLDHGELVSVGEPEKVCAQYLLTGGSGAGDYGPAKIDHDAVRINRVALQGAEASEQSELCLGDDVVLEFDFDLLQPVRRLVLSAILYTGNRDYLSSCDTEFDGMDLSAIRDGRVRGALRMQRPSLANGGFVVVFVIKDGERFLHRCPAAKFVVSGTGDKVGILHIEHAWDIHSPAALGGPR